MADTLLEDLLDDNTIIEQRVRVQVQEVFDFAKGTESVRPSPGRSKTLGQAKSLVEFYDLVRRAINDYESRQAVPDANKIVFVEDSPDKDSDTETISFNLVKRVPGAFSQGAPFDGEHRNLRPITREETLDDENPGYRIAVTGYWYDNLVQFTCWARTNKAANSRIEWFENLMEEYSWWFKMQGVDRTIFWGREPDVVLEIDGNKWYGRPINFFVRTEKLRVFREKTLEEIIIRLVTKQE